MAKHWYCDGVSRRDVLKVGVLGSTGLTLANYLRLAEAGEVRETKAKSAIFVFLTGGPTHMDSFDMKPDSPKEFRGEFNPIKTNVPGVEICEHLPKLAQCADKYAILRGVSHNVAAHELGQVYMNTGNRPLPSLTYPGYGAVITKERPGAADLPPFVAIPNTRQSSGFLGVRYSPLQTNATPRPGQPFSVRGVSIGGGLSISDIERRQRLLGDIDQSLAGLEKNSDLLDGLDKFSKQAHDLISSKKAREAFDVSKEPAATAEQFGAAPFGQSCLLATRLAASGVRFVTVTMGGWDTHQQNFVRTKDTLLPALDAGLSGLFNALATKGLLDSTAVFVTGEFGRTPKINGRGGRDHWARAMFVLAGGGGIKGGQVVGASDDKAQGPANEAITPEDVAATFYNVLGVDHHKEYHTNTGRPVMIVRNGNVIQSLLG